MPALLLIKITIGKKSYNMGAPGGTAELHGSEAHGVHTRAD